MIENKNDLMFYMTEDKKARGIGEKDITFANRISAFIPHPWRFQELLRKAEYYNNVCVVFV